MQLKEKLTVIYTTNLKLSTMDITQEVQTVVPNVVLKDTHGNLFVNYIELIPLITDSIQSLNDKIENLQKEISELKILNI